MDLPVAVRPAPQVLPPDPDQEAVLEHGRGVLLVLGAAGTGKTAVLRERMARLLDGRTDPERTVLVVASRRARFAARQALLRRVEASLPDLKVLTVHALAYQIVTRRAEVLEYDQPPEVLAAPDQFAVVRDLLAGEDPADWPAYGRMLGLRGFADQVRQFLLRAQEALVAPDAIEDLGRERGLAGWRELARFYRRYLDVLDGMGAVDFAGLVRQAGAAAGRDEPMFEHVLVDDYQDATFATERLLAELRPASLVVAGDPEAHVFSFQGTTDEPLRSFAARFPAASTVTLGTDHRSGGHRRLEAWSTPHSSEEHAAVARELRRLHVEDGVPWSELAVVLRRQDPRLGGLLRALDDAGIPRATPERGLSLLAEPATVPYVLALRWIARPEERDALIEPMLASDLARLSPAAARALIRAALAEGVPASDALRFTDALTPDEGHDAGDLGTVLAEAEAMEGSALDAFSLLWRRLPCSRRLVDGADATRRGRRDLAALVAFAEAVAQADQRADRSVAALLRHLEAGEEGPGTWTAGLEPDAVQVLTAHGAAGLEFDTVVVVGAVEGSFPSLSRPEPMFDLQALDRPVGQSERNRRRLQDERRLFGMVIGRARRRVLLTASSPEAGEAEEGARSRFVAEAGIAWDPAPAPPFPEPLTAHEAAAAWRRLLADPSRPAADRLAALDGLLGLGEDPRRWWFQRAWTGTDRPLHEAIRISHSKLSSLENCDLQFVLSQEIGLEGPAGYQAWVGSLVHRLIEDAENGVVERTEAAMVAAADERWRAERFPSLAVSEAFRRLVTRAMLPAWVREYGGAPAVAREIRFEFEFEGALVVGVIDRIGALQGGGSCVTDYKTGKSANAGKAEENLQLGMYYLAVSLAPELEPFRPVKGIELVFLRDQGRYDGQIRRAFKGFNARESAEYGQVMAEKLGGLIHHLEDLQRTEVYKPNPSANCRFCDFKELCSLWPEGEPVFPIGAGR